ncbi:hypothetical protein [uncultured Croceitalea sp.]|uniref:hypothetical protein n=1 Tax=uncultured Croceitalea sp. TaxID=1798908 RepID=UPI0033059BCB
MEYDNENKASSSTTVSISELLENYFIQNVFSKDSRFITDYDLNAIAQIIENSPNEDILITHGTITEHPPNF